MKTKLLTIIAIAMVIQLNVTTRAATITVTSTADSGDGSVRNALANAADGDTIDATGVSGTILLTSGELRAPADRLAGKGDAFWPLASSRSLLSMALRRPR